MTDATGRSFFCYRSKRKDDNALVIAAQRDHGIPTWHDEDLDELPVEEEIRRILRDENLVANAIIWVTPDAAESGFIKNIESPEILGRRGEGDPFFVLPVFAGGSTFCPETDERFRGWKVLQLENKAIGPDEAAAIARRVLDRRVRAVEAQLEPGFPHRISLHTYESAPFRPGTTLSLDWSGRCPNREISGEVWSERLLPALRAVASTMYQWGGGRPIVAGGLASLPAVTALGAAFPEQRGQTICWNQYTPGVPDQHWSLAVPAEEAGFEVKITPGDSRAVDLAVLVSVKEIAQQDFSDCKDSLPAFRAEVHIARKDLRPYVIPSPGQATCIARQVAAAMREARRECGAIGRVHLFMAVPAGLAMMIGQLLNTFGPVQTYERFATGTPYRPAALLGQ